MNNLIYQMHSFKSFSTNDDLDFFILASGSDNRAYEILSKYDFNIKEQTKVIVINFNERLADKASTDPLFDYKHLPIKHLQEIKCDIKNPSSCLEQFSKNSFDGALNIGLDISCLTKPYFYFILKLLKDIFGVISVNVFYTEPKSYKFSRGLFGSFSSSTGPLMTREVPGFSGHEQRGSRRKLIILLGFDGVLSREINEDVSPYETVVVNGFPSYSPKFKDISLITNEKLISDHNIQKQYARANHPFEVYNLLESIKNADVNAFMNIAPLGTKPMALGACLFALHNPDVRVVYPFPNKYKDSYSDKCWNSWMYKLPLAI
jgi:hypothetical protein